MSGIKMSIFSVRRSSFGKGPRFVLCFGNGARVSVLGLEHAAFKLEDFILLHAQQRTRNDSLVFHVLI